MNIDNTPEIPRDFLNYLHDKAQEAGDNLVIFQEQRTGYTAGYKAGGIAAYRKILEMITASNQRYSDVILDVRNAQKELATIKKLYALCVDERREQARLLESPEPPTPVLPEAKEDDTEKWHPQDYSGQLSKKQREMAALALFSMGMKMGPPSFEDFESIVKKWGIEEEFVGYARSWIDYPKKSPTVGDVIGDSEL